MEIIQAKKTDFETIKEIYAKARKFMIETGNSEQWHNNQPTDETILNDMEKEQLFVCKENEKIVGVFCFFVGEDSTYKKIYDGKWHNDEPYGVIHRIAVGEHKKGIATFCIQWCLKKFNNIRIDTHKDNIPMQKTILKNGFTYCGIIKKEDNTERLAYQSINKT